MLLLPSAVQAKPHQLDVFREKPYAYAMAEKTNKQFKEQFDDEEVLLVFRKHPVVMRKNLILGLLGPLLGVLPAAIVPNLGLNVFYWGLTAGIALGCLLFLPGFIAWYFSVFIVTDQRLIQVTQRGLFHRSIVDLGLKQIQSLNYEISGLQATLLGYGTIIVQTLIGDLVIHEVHHPAKIYKELGLILRDLGVTPVQLAPDNSELATDGEE